MEAFPVIIYLQGNKPRLSIPCEAQYEQNPLLVELAGPIQ
jgi:hypothetical protein